MSATTHQRVVRPPAVAGAFYPQDPAVLRDEVASFLREASSVGPIPKALIAPHAGYQYSGSVAACGYGGIRGLLKLARRRGLQVKNVDLRNSGDTSGRKDQVVGYGSYVVH